jgi:hypothetical protein
MQQHLPTIGDTVTVVRWVTAPPGAVIQTRAPLDSTIATLVAPPVLTREGDSVRIDYPLALWTAGRNDLVLPGAIVVAASGRVDTLPDQHVTLDVASVLPAAKNAAAIAPKSARPWLPRAYPSELPFAVLLPLAALLVLLLQWRWRRLGPSPRASATAPAPIPLTAKRITAWLAAGEARLALDHLEWQTRGRADFESWRERAAAVRFAPGDETAVMALVDEACARLTQEKVP